MRSLAAFVAAAVLAAILAACSTTKRLGPDETLYTGVKKFDIAHAGKEKLPDEMVADLKKTINVTPTTLCRSSSCPPTGVRRCR